MMYLPVTKNSSWKAIKIINNNDIFLIIIVPSASRLMILLHLSGLSFFSFLFFSPKADVRRVINLLASLYYIIYGQREI